MGSQALSGDTKVRPQHYKSHLLAKSFNNLSLDMDFETGEVTTSMRFTWSNRRVERMDHRAAKASMGSYTNRDRPSAVSSPRQDKSRWDVE